MRSKSSFRRTLEPAIIAGMLKLYESVDDAETWTFVENFSLA